MPPATDRMSGATEQQQYHAHYDQDNSQVHQNGDGDQPPEHHDQDNAENDHDASLELGLSLTIILHHVTRFVLPQMD